MSVPAQLSQSDLVVNGIKGMILEGRLSPGQRLPVEKDLAPQLGVSRSSLREGVRALCTMGVLETRQGAGTYVTSLDVSLLITPLSFLVDIQDASGALQVHAVRRVLETEAAGRAALGFTAADVEAARQILDESARAINAPTVDHEAVLDADLRFHRLIAHKADNKILAALIDALGAKAVRWRLRRLIADDHADHLALSQHRGILKALASGDPDHSRLLMASHLFGVEEFISDHQA